MKSGYAAIFLSVALVQLGAQSTESAALNAQAAELRALLHRAPRLALEKTELKIQPSEPGWEIGFPSSVAVGRDGTIYVLHRGEKTDPVIAMSRDGRILRSWGRGLFKIPHSIRVDPDGNIWTVDAASSRVVKFTPKGELRLEISVGGQPDAKSGFNGTTDIAFAPNGHLFISDGYGNARVLEYTSEGKRVREWGSAGSGPGQFRQPHGIAIDDQSVLYVADRLNGRLQRFDLSGRYLGEWTNLGMVTSVTWGAGGLWVGTQQRNEPTSSSGWILKLDRKTGEILGYVESFHGQHSVNVTPDGDLFSGARPDTVLWFHRSSPRSEVRLPTGYVDPSTCAKCHRDIAAGYAQTGMGRSFRAVGPNFRLPEFDGSSFHHEASEQDFTPGQRDGKYYLRRRSADGVLERDVQYVFGSGNHARSYLHRTPSGKLVELPLSWYAEKGGYWGMSPAYDRPDHLGFSREITYRCLFCHNGYPEMESGSDFWDGGSVFPSRLPEGIDCQRCHGPGRDHVNAIQQGAVPERVRESIVNPSRLNSDRQMEICMPCHLETTSGQLPPASLRTGRGVYSQRPGEPLANYMLHFDHAAGTGHDDKFELVSSVYRFRQSRCYSASAGALTCTTCHNPHQAQRGADAAAHYTEVCLRCHTQAMTKLVKEKRHPAAQECVGCHMPRRRPSDAVHIVITDHYIRARPVAAEPVREEHDGNTPPYAGEVALYYPRRLPKTRENELDLAIAQVKQQANLAGGLGQLERAIQQYRPERSEPYFELAEAYWRTGSSKNALQYYQAAAAGEPKRWYHYSSLGVALAGAGQPQRAVEAMERALSLAPGETTVLLALGEIYAGAGRLNEAESTFRKALALDSEMAEGWNNLGTTLLRAGDVRGAEDALREAVRLRPELAATHTNLANALSREGRLMDAKEQFSKAVRIGESAGNAVSPAKARERSDAHNNLGTAFAALGDSERALRQYRLAVAAAPDSVMANFNLGLALAESGKRAEARPYLEKASRGADPQVRKAAEELLKAR